MRLWSSARSQTKVAAGALAPTLSTVAVPARPTTLMTSPDCDERLVRRARQRDLGAVGRLADHLVHHARARRLEGRPEIVDVIRIVGEHDQIAWLPAGRG